MANPGQSTLHEVVALFDDPEQVEAAVAELESSGFDRADISFLARDAGADTRQAADDPAAPRQVTIDEPDLRQSRTLATSMAAVVAAFAAAGFTVMTGGAAALAAGIGAAAALGTGAAGTAIGLVAGEERQGAIDAQLAQGGVVIWVKTRDAAGEQRALSILERRGGRDVHPHTLSD